MWYIEMGGVYTINGDKHFGRKLYVEPNQLSEIRKRFNNTDVYATIFSYNKEDQNESDLYGPVYLDLDLNIETEQDYLVLKQELGRIVKYLELYYGIPASYIKFYFTGKKGFHLIIDPIIFAIEPDNNLNTYYKEIAKELNKATFTELIDTKIYDKKRLFRLSNSINGKSGLYKVPITYEKIQELNYEEIMRYAATPKPIIYVEAKECAKAIARFKEIKEEITKPKIKSLKAPMEIIDINDINVPTCIMSILQHGAQQGSRNNTTIILASSFFQKGASLEDTLSLIQSWNETTNFPSLSDQEIVTTVTSAYQQVQSGRRYGCTSIRESGLCVGRQCSIYK